MTTRHTQHQFHQRTPYAKGVDYALRGLSAVDSEMLLAGQVSRATLGGGLAMGSSAVYGGIIGGLSAASWEGAGTGALFGSGMTGVGTGIALTFAPMYGYDNWLIAPGLALLALGGGALVWGSYRFAKKRR